MTWIQRRGYEWTPCGDCLKGFIPVKTPRGIRYKRCDCNNGLRLTFTRVPMSLLRAINARLAKECGK